MTPESRTPVAEEISVVIPTLGRPILERSLEALAAGTLLPAEVVVVDQSGGDETARLIDGFRDRGLPATHVPSHGRGRAVGVNEGIRRVRTRFLLVTDDDCLAEPEWVAAMGRALKARPDAIVTGRIEAWEGGAVPVVSTGREPFVQRRPRLTFDSLSGGNMGAAVEILIDLGLLDEDPASATAEDAELGYRALRAGVPLAFEPASGVAHMDWREGDERAAQYRSYALSQGAFYGKYLRQGDLLIGVRVLVHMARAGKRWLSGILRGDPDLALNGRSYVIHLPPGIVRGWRSPRGVVRPGAAPPGPRSTPAPTEDRP